MFARHCQRWRDSQLVIFDCDGVSVDSEVISNRVLAEMLSAEGLPTTLAQARRDYRGLLLADVLSRAQEKLGRALPQDWLDPLPQDWLDRYETEGEELAAFEARSRETYDRMARISIAPDWARYFDFAAGRLPDFLRALISKE